MMLHFRSPAKLKTKMIVFEELYTANDAATLEELKELTSRRRAIEVSINERSSITEAIAREMSGGLVSRCEQDLQRISQYLPLLENLFLYARQIKLSKLFPPNSSSKICWSSPLGSTSFGRSPFFIFDHLRFELGMTLFLYGATLRERALEVLSSDLVLSATTFREAAGIFQYMAEKVVRPLQVVWKIGRAPETLPSISTVMSLICLAEAQAVTIRKAEEKGNSSSLLAKLHHGITEFLDEAIIKVLGDTTVRETKCISSHLMEFLCSCKSLHELKGKKYFAESLMASGQAGVAIGILRSSLSKVKEKIPREVSWKSAFQSEIQDASEVLRKFVRENDFVWHEKIPSEAELPLPQGNKIVNFIPYNPKRLERQLSLKVPKK